VVGVALTNGIKSIANQTAAPFTSLPVLYLIIVAGAVCLFVVLVNLLCQLMYRDSAPVKMTLSFVYILFLIVFVIIIFLNGFCILRLC
jgi:hypothetical protein